MQASMQKTISEQMPPIFLGKRLSENETMAGSCEIGHKPQPSKPQLQVESASGAGPSLAVVATSVPTAAVVVHAPADKPVLSKVIPRERAPLLQDYFESNLSFRYRSSRVEAMDQYLAPFESLARETKERLTPNSNPLLGHVSAKAPSKQKPAARGFQQPPKPIRPKARLGGNLLTRAENEVEYLENAFDFLEGYLREETPEDLEELSDRSGLPLSELHLWLDNKLDIVKTLKDVRRKF